MDPKDQALYEMFEAANFAAERDDTDEFTKRLMVRVAAQKAQSEALTGVLWLALVTTSAFLCALILPSVWPVFQESLVETIVKSATNYGLSPQTQMALLIFLLSGIGWAVAVKD